MAERLFLTDINLSGNSIKNVKDPVNATDVATKGYVDATAGLKLVSGKIVNTDWADNGDGSYSYTINLADLGIAAISAVAGSEHIPQIILFKKDLATGTTEIVDAQITFADISDGSTTTSLLKLTINFAPADGELFYFSVVGKPA